MADTNRTKRTVYVANVDQSITPDVLHSAFLPFGDIVDVSLPKDERSKDPHRGFGYVEFESPEDATAAIDNMDQSELYGRILKVSQAKPMKEKSEGLGSKLAVWEQEGWLAKHEVSEDDRLVAEKTQLETAAAKGADPMQGLEGLDVAGPKPQA